MENKENKLSIIVKESGLEETQAKTILDNFTGFFEEAQKWEEEAKKIKVTDITQVAKMDRAREGRLALKKIRVEADNTRKLLKEKSLREGKAIDGIANVIKALIVPVEQYLEAQEKFKERIEEEEKKQLILERQVKLSVYITEEELSAYNLGELSEDAFNNILSTSKFAHDAKLKAEKEAEDERIKKEKEREVEIEKQRLENIKLKKEADNAKKFADVKAKANAEIIADAKKKEDEAKEKQAKLEKEIKEKELAELKVKQEKEAKEKADKEAEAEEERKKKLAPEKDKLFVWSEQIKSIEVPTGLSKAGLQIVKEAEEQLLKISQDIKLKIKNL